MYNSCYTCRRRHVECQMSEPPCKKCQKAGLECLQKRPLRWVKGATFRGTAKASVNTPYKPDRAISSQFGSTVTIIKNLERWPATTFDIALSHIPLGLGEPVTRSLDEDSQYYLNYYSKCVCKLFVMFDSQRNPLRQLIPAAIAHPVLLSSVVALAARHRANITQTFDQILATQQQATALEPRYGASLYKYQAIRGLRQALDEGTTSIDILIVSAFLLILLDLFESGNDNWNFHVEGVKKLIAEIRVSTSSRELGTTIEGMRNFAMRQVYLIDTLGTTFTRPGLLVDSPTHQPSTTLQMSADKAYLGCPEYFLDVLRSFSAARDCLASLEQLDSIGADSLLHTIKVSLESTQSFDCCSWAKDVELPCSSNPLPTRTLQDLEDLGQAYKLGTLIYGWRVCDVLTGDSTPLEDIEEELISMLASLRSNEALFKCILWPLFVAGLETRDESQKQLVGDCLRRFWFETKCINVINAEKILQRFWAEAEQGSSSRSNWIFSMGQIDGDWLLI
ncbi:uncharacterized protein BP01DRAFT_302019 [Aspergillus saccharolyticus JOP 1030-1]|uniref:Zn(2)-C6 fungal-type domain-containing protein n=1 Tax=Aspergillus saccharolyticus JOP 1030-1 TaxID=1450539 RepID=A0A318ZS84_9EURO|nr:hypothetical protein BP01DRAFT_302019 [Aspergillus saccharolyticus JOP 1030-1]PYH42948.1 hypothetical protein BP01DRAFT_302019 [Aspergillus saccharolyticus JOP 1030-1]